MQGKGKWLNTVSVYLLSCYYQMQRKTSKRYITKLGDTPTIIKTPLQEVMSLKKTTASESNNIFLPKACETTVSGPWL